MVSLKLAVAFLAIMAGGDAVARPCCAPVETEFGRLRVEKRDLPKAMALGEHVRQSAKDFLGLTSIRIEISDAAATKARWGEMTVDGYSIYPWRFVRGARSITQPPDEILPHEIGHDLLRRFLAPSSRPGQYGTDVPDWLDEAVAIAFELPEDKGRRRCEAASLDRSGDLLSLHRFLSMEHPSLASIPDRGDNVGFVQQSKVDGDTPAFYALSLAFTEYLIERTGSTMVLAHLLQRARTTSSPERIVDELLASHEEEYDSAALERDFLAWLRSSSDYVC